MKYNCGVVVILCQISALVGKGLFIFVVTIVWLGSLFIMSNNMFY